jgi:hypothetical protein
MATHFTLAAASLGIALFLGQLLMIEAGRRWGQRQAALDPGAEGERLSGAEGAVYGLLGLLIAFTFSGAADRFEKRRDLIIDEANAIGTAYLRLDLLPQEAQPGVRAAFRKYVDSRILAYSLVPDLTAARAELARSFELQSELWKETMAAMRGPGAPSPQGVLPPINEMFDLASTRAARLEAHPPTAIFVMLVALALVSAFLVGFGMAGSKSSGLHALAYSAVLATVIYLILDFEYPRLGFIRIDAADHLLVDVRKGMN